MKDLDDYLDAAKTAQRIKSDSDLIKALGLKGRSTASWWRTRRAWPSDDIMVRLAQMAGYDPSEALLALNTWRAKSPEAQALYRQIAAKICAVLILFFTFIGTGNATGTSEHHHFQNSTLCGFRRRLAAWWRRQLDRSATRLKLPNHGASTPAHAV